MLEGMLANMTLRVGRGALEDGFERVGDRAGADARERASPQRSDLTILCTCCGS